ncbi:hypothetical protein Sjap_006423 [Stephania japonica]|uniref:Uncharacterized protein n=1 Tax=Stephania japonica TaxID=461633 RepID=A0AAP0K8D1_9MAGN
MEISATLLLPPIPRPTTSSPPSTLSFASSKSAFFNNGRSHLLKKHNIGSRAAAAAAISTQRGFNCRCLFGLGVPELAVIAGVVALVFGPKKLPEVGRSIGKTVKSFQQLPVPPTPPNTTSRLLTLLSCRPLTLPSEAAKEFESELKKEPDSAIESPPTENPVAISEEKKPETKVPSTEENL